MDPDVYFSGNYADVAIVLHNRYSGVIRGANAYVPPGARKATGETGGAKAAPKPQPATTPATNGKGPSAPEGTGQKGGPVAQAPSTPAGPASSVAAATAPQVSVTTSVSYGFSLHRSADRCADTMSY